MEERSPLSKYKAYQCDEYLEDIVVTRNRFRIEIRDEGKVAGLTHDNLTFRIT
ncbi:MAG: hypothetical protein ACUVR0_00745 [Candidatus Aminicenantales bacterium]